ncbi:hypothetical protein ACFLQO_00700 [Candidatus Aenigmatarchaeota archaeon]
MAIPDISGLLSVAPAMMRDLPQILNGMQIVFYIVLILGFGSIIVKGYRGYAHFAIKMLMRLGFGFVALVCGIGISGIIPAFSNNAFYTIIQSMIINPFLGIIISTIVLTISLYMISHNASNALNVSNTLFVDGNTGHVGIDNSTPLTKLSISDTANQLGIVDSDGNQEWRLIANSNLFFIEDEITGAIPFKIEDGADTNTLIIDDSGNVGIGTTSPSYRLEVANTSNALNISNILFVDGQTENVGIGTDSPTKQLEIKGSADVLFDGDTSAFLRLDRNANTNFANVVYQTAGTQYWRIGMENDGTDNLHIDDGYGNEFVTIVDGGSTGNVGIGTTAPGYLLEIHNASNALNVSDILFVDGDTERVGIGTDSPDFELHVNGKSYATRIHVESPESENAVISFRGDGTGTGYVAGRLDTGDQDSFGIARDGLEWDLVVDSDGRVGIGHVYPDAMLEVLNDTGAQLMLTHTADTDYANFTVDSDGNLTISASSGNVIIQLG